VFYRLVRARQFALSYRVLNCVRDIKIPHDQKQCAIRWTKLNSIFPPQLLNDRGSRRSPTRPSRRPQRTPSQRRTRRKPGGRYQQYTMDVNETFSFETETRPRHLKSCPRPRRDLSNLPRDLPFWLRDRDVF